METPDKWMLIRITGTNPHWRIFATWGGGYTYGDSWRLNSGVGGVENKDEWFDFHGYSGSLYRCYKMSYGTTMYGMNVLKDLIEKSDGKAEAIWEEPENVIEYMGLK
jgi:hypothetical protein